MHANHFTVCDAGKGLASLFVTVIAKVDTNDRPFFFCLQFVYFRNSVQMLPPFIPKTLASSSYFMQPLRNVSPVRYKN